MKGEGLLIALGKPKSKDDMPMSEKDVSSSDFDDAADTLYEAAQDKDQEGFRIALKAAIHACVADYKDEEDEEGEA